MRRIAPLFVSVVVALVGAMTLVSASPSANAAGGRDRTPYALKAYGFGAKMKGGDLPSNMGPTAQAVIGCTNVAGLRRQNALTTADLPDLGRIEGMRTTTWTTREDETVSSYSRHRIDGVVLVENVLGKLTLAGIETTARAWHDRAGFHASTKTSIAGLRYKAPGADPVELELPELGQPIKIPGVATVKIAPPKRIERSDYARANATGLVIKLHETSAEVTVARSVAEIGTGGLNGVFSGYSYGVQANVLGEVVGVGKNPHIIMPCRGTDGEIEQRTVSNVPLTGVVDAATAVVTQRSKVTRKRSFGFERAEVAAATLLGERIEAKDITARVNVTRKRSGELVRDIEGTETAEIIVDGEPRTVPPAGVLEIPGLVRIEEGIVQKVRGGLKVIALRLTLLDGSSTVVELGVAQLRIGRAAD